MSHRLKHVGWQVGITYQTENRSGLNRRYLHDLLTEMSDHGMNFISFMMISYAMNDPVHDGYAWPVENPRLNCYKDEHCTNADKNTEFLTEIMYEASERGFHVNLFMNGFWWNHDRVKVGYPDIRNMGETGGAFYHHCADNNDTWQLACDEIADLLRVYSKSPVSSYGFETIGRAGPSGRCTCPDTMRRFTEALAKTGISANDVSSCRAALFELWNSFRDWEMLAEIVLAIKRVAPAIEIWHHGYMQLGDFGGYRFSANSYKKAGVDVAMPCVHTLGSEDDFKKILSGADGFPVVLHVDTRDKPTLNYDVPAKTPEYIRRVGGWVRDNDCLSLEGIIFFNEPATSKEIRQAVYDVIRDWRKSGIVA